MCNDGCEYCSRYMENRRSHFIVTNTCGECGVAQYSYEGSWVVFGVCPDCAMADIGQETCIADPAHPNTTYLPIGSMYSSDY